MDSLVVFARAPVPGQTKTRLAHSIGDEAAAAIAAAMLRDTLATARQWGQQGGEASVAYSPADAFGPGPGSLAAFWDGDRFPQSEGDIGTRMLAALHHEWDRGARRVVIIGSDAPEISVAILTGAFAALGSHDLSFGPAHDGGFTYIGARHAVPAGLFENVEWSSSNVLNDTLTSARRIGLTYDIGPLLHDIDEFEDLTTLSHRLQATQLAPHTRSLLNLVLR